MTALALYDQAKRMLAEAANIDEVLGVRDMAQRLRLYAQQAQDTEMAKSVAGLQMRAERRLGEMLIAEKAAGHLTPGRRKKSTGDGTNGKVSLEEIGVSRNLSSRCQKAASISERAYALMIEQRLAAIGAKGATIINPVTTEEKRQRRAEREAELAKRQKALPAAKYGVILADPAWSFSPYSRLTGMDRAADNHYPTQTVDAIAALDVPSIAADDCALFLWATVPMLPAALVVMERWGFVYKSLIGWDKVKIGTGYWFRNRLELLLVGTKGAIVAPAMGDQAEGLLSIAATDHSAKPEAFHEIIEHYFPNLPKIELNRRGAPRPGWAAWGNETVDNAPSFVDESALPAA